MNLKFIKEHVKAAYNGILPASVRYDVNLNDKTKLLYAEITASMNHLGYCNHENNYFAKLFGVSVRTISNHINSLFERKYIELEFLDNNKRRIKLPSTPISFIQPPTFTSTKNVISEEDQAFLDKYIKRWEEALKIKLYRPQGYYKAILELLQDFSKEDLEHAMENRINLVTSNDWYDLPENRRHATNLGILVRDGDSFTKALNMAPAEDNGGAKTTLSSFNFS